jgi:hypothetical protein
MILNDLTSDNDNFYREPKTPQTPACEVPNSSNAPLDEHVPRS